MYLTDYLTQSERDELLLSLTDKQKEFFKEHLRRGRKTIFANVLAREKASSVDDTTITEIASQWELQDYIDAGPGWRSGSQLFCECGRALRYQYIVYNKETSEVKKFGITHFEEHVGIPPHLVKEIVKGIAEIDYEGDEILMKIENGWVLADEQIYEIPNEIEVPKDVQLHFDYDIPLLNRQILRLKRMIAMHLKEIEEERVQQQRLEKEMKRQKKESAMVSRREAMLQSREWKHGIGISVEEQAGIMIFLEDLDKTTFLASNVCEYLVAYHGSSGEKYSSGSFKIFSFVCIFLEELVRNGQLQFVAKKYGMDREYALVTR